MAVELFVDVITKDSAAGSEYVAGFGPLQVLRWTSSSEMDRAGTFAFDVLSNETTLSAIRRLRKVRCYAFVNNVLTEVGNGIIDKISTELDGSERTLLRVSGYDMLWELNYRSVGFLDLSDVLFGLTHSVALSAIMAFAPSGWTATPSGSPDRKSVV